MERSLTYLKLLHSLQKKQMTHLRIFINQSELSIQQKNVHKTAAWRIMMKNEAWRKPQQ